MIKNIMKLTILFTISYIITTLYGETWLTKQSAPTGRIAPRIGVANGRLYLIGGWIITNVVSTNEEYDPITDTWTTKAPMPTARYDMTIGVVFDTLYVIGGADLFNKLSVNEAYDPVSDTWKTGLSAMPTSRSGAACGVVNNKIYVIGGYNGSIHLVTNEEYNPSTDTWQNKTSMPTARRELTASVINGKIYVIGGYNGSVLDINEVYDPLTDTWSVAASMPTARRWLASGAISTSGMIYAIGGYDGSIYSDTNEEYNFATDSWATKLSMPTPRWALDIGVINNKIYAVGGYNNSATPLNTNEEYTPDISGLESAFFYAISEDLCVILHWSFNLENQILLFRVLRKSITRNSNYMEIVRIPASGSSPSPKIYCYKDEDVKPEIQYFYKLGVVKENGSTNWYGPVSAVVTGTRPFLSISPNPFSTSTTISFTHIGQNAESMGLNIYDVSGRLVKRFTIYDSRFTDVTWDGKDDNGKVLPSGVYYCRLSQGNFTESRKILLVK